MAGLPDLEECKLGNARNHPSQSQPPLMLICWTGLQDANNAFNISLVSPSKSGLSTIATFQPKFTYSIFGEEEKIFGYKDLKILLRYRANDMRPHLRVTYGKKFKPVGEHEPTDVVDILESGGHLPKGKFEPLVAG